MITVATACLLVALSARNAAAFVCASSGEPAWRVPAAVGRKLERMTAEHREGARVVSLVDDVFRNGVLALYARLPIASVEPLVGDLPAATTHVVYVPGDGAALSEPAAAIQQRLRKGTLPADAVSIESAAIWTLHSPAPDASSAPTSTHSLNDL